MRKHFVLIAMSCALSVPVAMSAQEHNAQTRPEQQQAKHYEDKAHNDSHEWNSTENEMYTRYLQEHHKKPHSFDKASKKEQEDYWNWRHQHPDERH